MKKDFYKRQEILLKDKQNNLNDKKLIIIGAGGLGSSISYALASSGISEIFIIDFDTVSLSNIQRQIMFDLDDVGKSKVECFHKLSKRSFAKINTFNMSAAEFFSLDIKADLVMDATDNLATRKEIDAFSKANNIPWVFASVEEFYASVCIVKDKNLAFKDELKRTKPQCPPMVMLSAAMASNLALKYLAGYEIRFDYLYYFDFSKDQFTLNKFNL